MLLSAHRHISLLHYTGYIWYSMGISHPVFATRKGKLLAKLVHPLESWAEKHVGGSMRTTLKQRHQMIDDHLSTLIQQHPNLQVLEIASGCRHVAGAFANSILRLTIVNSDYRTWYKWNSGLAKQIDQTSPAVLSADLFSADFARAFRCLT